MGLSQSFLKESDLAGLLNGIIIREIVLPSEIN